LKIKEIPEEKKNNIRSAYAFLETFLEGNDYLAGNHYTIADMCCIATVSSIVVIFIFAFIVFLQTKTKRVNSWK
jgi:glutathione S-transferase